jgi:hypothetical protein
MKLLPISERFWSKVRVSRPDECWEWQAKSKHEFGYGLFRVGGRKGTLEYAHRISWKLCYGYIPKGLCVLHKCDNPLCINPSHLFLGTQLDNIKDTVSKNRTAKGNMNGARIYREQMPRGENSPVSKLTNAQTAEIRDKYVRFNISQRKLAKEYGVSSSTISLIVTHKIRI